MNGLLAYIYDFLSAAFENKLIEEEVKEVILFGSAAKKNYDEKSDIDVFFNIMNKEKSEEIEEALRESLKSFEIKAEKSWALKKITFPISFIVGLLDDKQWRALKDEIASSGKVLYGPYKELPGKIIQKYLIYYSLNNLKRKEKMKFIRELFGYSIKKGKKEYLQRGLISKLDGIKLASNVILVNSQTLAEIKAFFNKNKVEYKIIESWIRM